MGIGNAIKAQRLQLNMTQEELAAAMGYKSKSTINKIEMGVNDIPLSKVSDFAKALHTTTAKLMGWEESEGDYDALKDANWDAILPGYSYARAINSNDDLGQLIETALSLEDDKMQQLIQYAKFLESQEEK